jgi:hypothetical protein
METEGSGASRASGDSLELSELPRGTAFGHALEVG